MSARGVDVFVCGRANVFCGAVAGVNRLDVVRRVDTWVDPYIYYMVPRSIFTLSLVLLEILCLLEDFFVDLVAVDGRVAVVCE